MSPVRDLVERRRVALSFQRAHVRAPPVWRHRLVQQRMKRAGMRWSDLGARGILHLRCTMLNAQSWTQRPSQGPLGEDLLVEIRQHPLDDAYWASKRAELASIRVPALVCASWSDHGLHTRGSLEGFRRIGSEQKWLYTHGRGKWETFDSSEAQALQLRFFDCFLKETDSGMLDVPRARLEVRRAYYTQDARGEAAWPVPGTTTRRVYLDAIPRGFSAAPRPGDDALPHHTTPHHTTPHHESIRDRIRRRWIPDKAR